MDIVERLRLLGRETISGDDSITWKAADEIERLRKHVADVDDLLTIAYLQGAANAKRDVRDAYHAPQQPTPWNPLGQSQADIDAARVVEEYGFDNSEQREVISYEWSLDNARTPGDDK